MCRRGNIISKVTFSYLSPIILYVRLATSPNVPLNLPSSNCVPTFALILYVLCLFYGLFSCSSHSISHVLSCHCVVFEVSTLLFTPCPIIPLLHLFPYCIARILFIPLVVHLVQMVLFLLWTFHSIVLSTHGYNVT